MHYVWLCYNLQIFLAIVLSVHLLQLPNSAIKQCQPSAKTKVIESNRNYFAGPKEDQSLPESRA